MTIYNSLQPPEPLQIDDKIPENKRPKIAAFKFVEACLKGDLKLPPGECFSLQDLFGDDTTGFVKVCPVSTFLPFASRTFARIILPLTLTNEVLTKLYRSRKS